MALVILFSVMGVAAFLVLVSFPLQTLVFFLIGRQKTPASNAQEAAWPKDWPGLTCVIPAANEASVIREKVEDLRTCYPSDRMSVIVVLNNSTDATREICRRIGVQTVESAPGKLCALETGRRAAETDLILATDADVFFEPDTVKTLVADMLCAAPDVCAVSAHSTYILSDNSRIFKEMDRQAENLGKLACLQGEQISVPMLMGTAYVYRKNNFPPYPESAAEDEISVAIEILRNNSRSIMSKTACCYQNAPQDFRNLLIMLTRHAGRQIHTCLMNADIIWTAENRFFRWFIFPFYLLLPRCLPLVSILFLLLPSVVRVPVIPLYSSGLVAYLLIWIVRPFAAMRIAALHFGWLYIFLLPKKTSVWHNPRCVRR